MSAQALPLEMKPLSQAERVVDTFVAPSKTFTDILRSTSWWLPFLLVVLVSVPYAWSVSQKVGFDAIAEHEASKNSFMQERMASLAPAQRAAQIQRSAVGYKYSMYATPVIFIIFTAIYSLLLWASFNFGMGASTTFGQMFAICWYATLPKLLIFVITIVLLWANVGTERFDMRNPAGTNLGYYLGDSAAWLKTAGSFLDVFGLWTLALLILGTSIVARKSRGQAAAIVVGWWLLGLLLSAGASAAFG